MKVVDYARTRIGDVGKIIEKYKGISGATIYKIDRETEDFDCTSVFDWEIIKSSPNIIDLIEVGDYVNGMQVTRICFDEDGKRILNLSNCILELMNEDIKTIVTKEQFESMEYKVGD